MLALLALVVVMFSLEARPRPHSADLAPDAFSGTDAYRETGRLAARFPDRSAGSPGDAALGDFVERRFRELGMETSRQTFFTDVDGKGDAELSNVIGRLRGRSDRQVVILSHRDSAGRPGASSASGTAVLLELAQALDALDRRRTIVFVSTDGATEGLAGARRFAERYADRQKVEAALRARRRRRGRAAAAVRDPLVDRIEPCFARDGAHRRRGARTGDRRRRRLGVVARPARAPRVAADLA